MLISENVSTFYFARQPLIRLQLQSGGEEILIRVYVSWFSLKFGQRKILGLVFASFLIDLKRLVLLVGGAPTSLLNHLIRVFFRGLTTAFKFLMHQYF